MISISSRQQWREEKPILFITTELQQSTLFKVSQRIQKQKNYEETSIIEDGKFIGLALDEENQPNLTPKRIGDWIAEIKKEFK